MPVVRHVRNVLCLLLQDELVLVEHTTDQGKVVQIVYRNGGLVDATALESLCDKVQ